MNQPSLTRWDALKLIAVFLMFVDHAGAFYFVGDEWLRGIGRACAPIFLFLAGFAPHYRFSKRLFALAVFLTAVDWWVKGAPNTLTILWGIVAIRLLFAWMEARSLFKVKLHEWFIGAIPFLALLPFVQYGPFCLLFGLCGYVYKHRTHYAPDTPARFLALVTLYYGGIYCWFSQFNMLTSMVTFVSLAFMLVAIRWFANGPMTAVRLPRALKPISRYTAEIYVAHLAALILITGKSL